MKQFIKDMHTKQFSVNDMLEFANEVWGKYNFDESSVERWFNKKQARLESIRHVLANFDYKDKDKSTTRIHPDPNVVMRFHRSINRID